MAVTESILNFDSGCLKLAGFVDVPKEERESRSRSLSYLQTVCYQIEADCGLSSKCVEIDLVDGNDFATIWVKWGSELIAGSLQSEAEQAEQWIDTFKATHLAFERAERDNDTRVWFFLTNLRSSVGLYAARFAIEQLAYKQYQLEQETMRPTIMRDSIYC